MINAMGLQREQVYIANIVKCRPPKNRVPEPIEANTCKPFLFQQIGVIQPEVIVALGSTAATYLLAAKTSLNSLRGRIHHAFNTKLIVTYHPAFLLRDPAQKKEAWKDTAISSGRTRPQAKTRPGIAHKLWRPSKPLFGLNRLNRTMGPAQANACQESGPVSLTNTGP